MKQVKLNLLAIIGMMVAVGTVAFTAPKENLEPTWYEVLTPDANGDRHIGDPLVGSPTGDCVVQFETNVCAVQIDMATPPPLYEDLDDDDILSQAGRPD